MFTLINKRDMYSKPLETEEEPARHDWIDNFKGYPQPDTIRILYMKILFKFISENCIASGYCFY